MTVRIRYSVAAAVGLFVAHPLLGQEPAKLGAEVNPTASIQVQSANQQLANSIADHLRQSGQLRRFSINVACNGGTAELSGTVADQPQREEALRIVQGTPGVEKVRDLLQIEGTAVVQVQDNGFQVAQQPAPRLAPQPPGARAPYVAIQEPLPLGGAVSPAPYDLNPPKMPPYAWPTYAPYNNFSRVGYPEAYPYNAWPFIGPVYPFPKVPPGWRSVKLEWEDGHWWYSKTASKHDWWHLRYW